MTPNSAEFTAMVTGQGLNGSYLHRFKIIPNSTCPCGLKQEQKINHIILNSTILENERRVLRNPIVRTGETWPLTFEQLTRKHVKTFRNFARSIDFSALFIRRGIKQIVIIIGAYQFCQPLTKFYPTSCSQG